MKHRIYGLLALTGLALLGGCVQLPDGIEPVTPFQADRYLGHWYEIARLDHRFESDPVRSGDKKFDPVGS